MAHGIHIAVIGVGRLGQAVAFRVLQEPYVSKLTLMDIRGDVVEGVAEEFNHYVAVASNHDVEVVPVTDASRVEGAEIVIITAGRPRTPNMSRRDLAGANAKIMRDLAEKLVPANPNAVYLIATNPVDAMTMVFKRFAEATAEREGAKSPAVYGFGTMLDTARLRSILARHLGVEPSRVTGFYVGEHGESGFVAWSTVYVDGVPVEEWAREHGRRLDKAYVEERVKRVAAEVIAKTGATTWGPSGAFIRVVRAFALPEDSYIAFGVEQQLPGVEEPVVISAPTVVTRGHVRPVPEMLSEDERSRLSESAKAILAVFKQAYEAAGGQ